MLKDTITVDQLSLVISQAAAPAFLLGAVASFLSVLVMHMSRILDRSRAINDISGDDPRTRELKVLGGRKRHHNLPSHDRCLCLGLYRRST